MAAKNKSNEILITRIYEAPLKTVWDAFTEPEQAAQWWGPRGFTLTTYSKDLRPGGIWHYTMHGPDGTDYQNKTVYLEVEKHKKLVYDHGGDDDRPPLFRVTVLFSELKGRTKMDMTMTLPTAEDAEQTRQFIKQAGGNSTWDRFAEYLDKSLRHQDSFVINRSFEAPINVVFEMWTEANHFSQWLAPVGFHMKFLRADIQEGKTSFYVMENNDNVKMYGRIEYLKIEKPHTIAYKQSFCDEREQPARHIFDPSWPETMLTLVTLSEEEAGCTRVTVTWTLLNSATDSERNTFIKGRTGMTQGWTGSFDKLEEYLQARL
ncbi:MAG: SRPBCC family protein [Bdellovibrio sp.]